MSQRKCGNCGISGHDRRTCPHHGFPIDKLYEQFTFPDVPSHNTQTKRKRCEAPFSELFFSIIFINPFVSLSSYKELNYASVSLSDKQRKEYTDDIKARTETSLNKWYLECQKKCQEFWKIHNIKQTDKFECYLTGKTVTHPKIHTLLSDIKDTKTKKADVYFCINKTKWFGFSIKTTPCDTNSNWAIESLIAESCARGVNIRKKIEEERIKYLTSQGIIKKVWRQENKEENRKIYNSGMYDKNKNTHATKYKKLIYHWITDKKNKEFLKETIANAAGSRITTFRMFKYDGNTFTDLHDCYNKIINSKTFSIIRDTEKCAKEYFVKSHYSDAASKLWCFIEISKKIEYRIEIRWKGEPYHSMQMFLHTM